VFTFVTQNNEIPIMTDRFKKIDRAYVLSDSSVNEYGFRLLTSGYQLASFQKNPIGYYMHKREDGIVLKWEDLHIEDDKIVGTPVINLSNERGEQTCDEVENGFLNAASVGHIVVLEYSTDPEAMLPGQTGPTITKWYNKECSLVDIPGNCNALTRLYDAQENEINLVDISGGASIIQFQPEVIKDLSDILQLSAEGDASVLVQAVRQIKTTAEQLAIENKQLQDDKTSLQAQLDEMNEHKVRDEVLALLERGLEDKKITVELKNRLAHDYAGNPEGLRSLIAAMPAYRSIVDNLRTRPADQSEAQWQWDDYEQKDPTGKKLKELKANNPVKYRELFDKKFAA